MIQRWPSSSPPLPTRKYNNHYSKKCRKLAEWVSFFRSSYMVELIDYFFILSNGDHRSPNTTTATTAKHSCLNHSKIMTHSRLIQGSIRTIMVTHALVNSWMSPRSVSHLRVDGALFMVLSYSISKVAASFFFLSGNRFEHIFFWTHHLSDNISSHFEVFQPTCLCIAFSDIRGIINRLCAHVVEI